jgi:NAD(P)-dependent dehydrogenase (short-subunit alcohol dehydrogenase family)
VIKTQSLGVVFGGTGSIGKSIVKQFSKNFKNVIVFSRNNAFNKNKKNIFYSNWNGQSEFPINLIKRKSINSVVWSQGINFSDNIKSFKISEHKTMYEANVVYILKSLNSMISNNLLANSARLCIVSSIWQNLARQNKLSYTITKSALQGLVNSLTIDLGSAGFLVNAVLPGVINTPMTKKNLSKMEIENIKRITPLKSLATLEDIAKLVFFLCSKNNSGITGQFITVDRGFSNARIF